MTRRLIAEIAWPWTPEPIAEIVEIGDGVPGPGGVAVYIALDVRGRADYVGSSTRVSGTLLKGRIREHLRDGAKRRDWVRLAVVPLRADTPPRVVRRIEGQIGRALKPARARRLPRAE